MEGRVTRIVLAVAIAPLATLPVVVAIYSMLDIRIGEQPVSLLDLVVLSAIPSLSVAYPMTAVLGVPCYFVLVRFRRSSYFSFALVGALFTLLAGIIVFDLRILPFEFLPATLLAASGAAVAIVFRAIAGVPE